MTAPSPDKLLAAHEGASVGMAVVCAEGPDAGRFVRVNRALSELLGYPEARLLELSLEAVTHPEDVELGSRRTRALAAAEVGSDEIEIRLLRADGEIAWVQLHVSLMLAVDDSPSYVVIQVVDVTALTRTAAQLAAVIDSALDAIITADGAGTILEFNPAAEQLFGVSEADAVGSSLELIVPAERLDGLMRLFRGEDAYLLGRRMVMDALDAEGRTFPVELVITRIGAEPPVFTGFVRDLTRAHAARQALSESEGRHRHIVEAAFEGIWTLDSDAQTTFLNRRAAQMLGYEPQDLLGRSPLELLDAPSRDAVAEALERRPDDHAREHSATFVHKDGRPVHVLLSATPLLDDDESYAGWLVMVTDVTARLRAEHERAELETRLRQAQRLETVGQLAGGVAHDFNNLLSVIEGYADFLAGEVGDTPAAVEGIEEIRRAAERGAKLTRRLLMFSRRDRADPQTADLRKIVADSRTALETTLASGSELTLELPDEPLWVTVDVHQFEQVLLNLAANARDAMPDGGELTVALRRRDDGCVELEVSDTGAGMPAEVAERAFEPFYTTKPRGEGSGLGLATVFGVVTQSGGEVRLVAAPGEGTRVLVELPPASGPAPGDPEQPRETDPLPASGQVILLVEDEDALRAMAARILRRHGYEVLESSGAEQALAAFRGLDCPPDLVLTDVAMPRMSGVELAARLGKSSPPVVFMSGYTDESVGDPDVLAHSAGFLHKPFSAAALLSRVGEALTARGV